MHITSLLRWQQVFLLLFFLSEYKQHFNFPLQVLLLALLSTVKKCPEFFLLSSDPTLHLSPNFSKETINTIWELRKKK